MSVLGLAAEAVHATGALLDGAGVRAAALLCELPARRDARDRASVYAVLALAECGEVRPVVKEGLLP